MELPYVVFLDLQFFVIVYCMKSLYYFLIQAVFSHFKGKVHSITCHEGEQGE
jgi:hypothetical protein